MKPGEGVWIGTMLDYLSTHQGSSGPVVTHFYAIANVYDNFKDAAEVDLAGTDAHPRQCACGYRKRPVLINLFE
jgi:hypothetical protein